MDMALACGMRGCVVIRLIITGPRAGVQVLVSVQCARRNDAAQARAFTERLNADDALASASRSTSARIGARSPFSTVSASSIASLSM